MLMFFQYNWQVRNEWFEWCKELSANELKEKRIGGVENILNTLLHIVDVETSWIRAIQNKRDYVINFDEYTTLEKVKDLSDLNRREIEEYLLTWSAEIENEITVVPWSGDQFTKGEIVRHVIAHEIHHIGQLSVWARELDRTPVSASLIDRGLLRK
ncbi:DinB family protein [Bacillus sp. RG28]|uniref:DinB family protein n=1 Tax=Gottfriedia endophytica TaxID=2820819 RepID=A0A940NHD4_9BACI|nr:DinB family protein [Gottfriedia endophytica]MBP0724315.1 DinB family protein [Gottfriedia endophytica]